MLRLVWLERSFPPHLYLLAYGFSLKSLLDAPIFCHGAVVEFCNVHSGVRDQKGNELECGLSECLWKKLSPHYVDLIPEEQRCTGIANRESLDTSSTKLLLKSTDPTAGPPPKPTSSSCMCLIPMPLKPRMEDETARNGCSRNAVQPHIRPTP